MLNVSTSNTSVHPDEDDAILELVDVILTIEVDQESVNKNEDYMLDSKGRRIYF